MKQQLNKSEILFISTIPPRKCGIATFTRDLTNSLKAYILPKYKISICALDDSGGLESYAEDITMKMDSLNQKSCLDCADRINSLTNIKLVCIEHEFGLFGGEMGNYLIPFLDALKKPFIIRFHTVLPNPCEKRLMVVQRICMLAEKIIVMTRHSVHLLRDDYYIREEKIILIPHGTHPVNQSNTASIRAKLNLEDKKILTTFGLLSPNKGIETGIKSMTKIVKEFPNAIYLVLGNTHPKLVDSTGETYRHSLEKLISDNCLHKNVKLIDEFLPTDKLLSYLAMSDIYLFTSKDPYQAVSGTFIYAMSAGCSIISNPIAHSYEMLDKETGILMEKGDEEEIAANVLYLLNHDDIRKRMGIQAFLKTRDTLWDNVAKMHFQIIYDLIENYSETLHQQTT